MIITFAYILFVLVVVAVVYWAVDQLGTPDPLNKIIKVGTVAVAIIIVVLLFMQLVGVAPSGINLPRP